MLVGLITLNVNGQTVVGKLHCSPGQNINVRIEVKTTVTQQVMGKAISFEADGYGMNNYRVLDTAAGKTTLEHTSKSIRFKFNGMGQKQEYDSGDSLAVTGRYGASMKSLLSQKYEITVDEFGTVVSASPGKIEPVKTDDRLAIILNMIEDVSGMSYPPAIGSASVFKVMPGREMAVGESWVDSTMSHSGKIKNVYTLSAITDSTIVVDIKTTTSTAEKAMVMGGETITTLSSIATGVIVVDRQNGLIKEKKIITESNGAMEAMGSSTPVTSKTYLNIYLNPG